MTAPKIAKPAEEPLGEEMQVEKSADEIIKGTMADDRFPHPWFLIIPLNPGMAGLVLIDAILS